MHVSTTEVNVPDAMSIQVTDDALIAELSDGRSISVPLCWYPRLAHATPEERDNWEPIGTARASIGLTWTKTSASRDSWPAGSPAKANAPSSGGWRPSRLAFRRISTKYAQPPRKTLSETPTAGQFGPTSAAGRDLQTAAAPVRYLVSKAPCRQRCQRRWACYVCRPWSSPPTPGPWPAPAPPARLASRRIVPFGRNGPAHTLS